MYVLAAYGIAVAVIGGYVWSVARRRRAAERELAGLDRGASDVSDEPEVSGTTDAGSARAGREAGG